MENKQLSTEEKIQKVEGLKVELEKVLSELNEVAELKFHDNDCDDVIFSYGDTKYDEGCDSVHIDMYMWRGNNLPNARQLGLDDNSRKK